MLTQELSAGDSAFGTIRPVRGPLPRFRAPPPIGTVSGSWIAPGLVIGLALWTAAALLLLGG